MVVCDLCAKSADGPRCVSACPTKALELVDEDMLEALGRTRRLEAIAKNQVAMHGARAANLAAEAEFMFALDEPEGDEV